MPSIVSNNDAEKCLRTVLKSDGYELSPERRFGETGVDVIASRESFFRAISRLKGGAKKCVIALPINTKIGLPARANQCGIAWERIGMAFPELEIWLIDTEKMAIKRSTWLEWGQPTMACTATAKSRRA